MRYAQDNKGSELVNVSVAAGVSMLPFLRQRRNLFSFAVLIALDNFDKLRS